MNTYTVVTKPISPFARRVFVACHQLKLDVKMEPVDLVNKPAWFLEKNPLGQIPVFIYPNGEILTDSNAILEVLNDEHGGIWPTNLAERRRVRKFSALAVGLMENMVGHFFGLKLENPPPAMLTKFIGNMERVMAFLEKFQNDDAVAGKQLTQAGRDLGMALEGTVMTKTPANMVKFDFSPVMKKCNQDEYFVQSRKSMGLEDMFDNNFWKKTA